LWNNSCILGPIPSTTFKSSCLILFPKTAFAASASKGIVATTALAVKAEARDVFVVSRSPSRDSLLSKHAFKSVSIPNLLFLQASNCACKDCLSSLQAAS
jgi:hypothetical protein